MHELGHVWTGSRSRSRKPPASTPSCLRTAATVATTRSGSLLKTAASSPAVGTLFGFTEPDWNCEMYRGGFTIMFNMVSNYNGKKNDSSVRFDMYSSTGLQQLPRLEKCRTDITARRFNPTGTNYLPPGFRLLTGRSLAAPSIWRQPPTAPTCRTSKVADSTFAFVRGGYLFAKLPEASELWLDGENTPVPGIRLTMRRPFVVGELVRLPDDTWTIKHGTVAMVVLPGDMLTSFKEFGFCGNMCASFDTVRSYFNASADMLATTDEILPDSPCDALSSAYDFEARQATARRRAISSTSTHPSCVRSRATRACRARVASVSRTASPASRRTRVNQQCHSRKVLVDSWP